MHNPKEQRSSRFIKTPWGIYGLTLVFFCLAMLFKNFKHQHPAAEGYVLYTTFWILNLGTLVVGLAWWSENKRRIGAIGIVLALLLAVLFFTVS
jgi:hypothetical protein